MNYKHTAWSHPALWSIAAFLGLLVGSTGCKRSPSESTPQAPATEAKSQRRALGQTCTLTSQCLKGAICDLGTCEAPGPCVAYEGAGGRQVRRAYRYTSDGYERGSTALASDGEPELRSITTPSEDRRTITFDMALTADKRHKVEVTLDSERRALTTRHPDSFEVHELTEAGACLVSPAVRYESDKRETVIGRTEVECNDGLPVKQRDINDRTKKTTVTTYTYDKQRRLTTTSIDWGDDSSYSMRRVRHADGYTVGLDHRDGDPKTSDVSRHERWDLTCWQPKGDTLTYVPDAKKRTSLDDMKSAVDGRWRVSGDSREQVIVDIRAMTVRRMGRANSETPMTLEAGGPGQLKVTIGPTSLIAEPVEQGLLVHYEKESPVPILLVR